MFFFDFDDQEAAYMLEGEGVITPNDDTQCIGIFCCGRSSNIPSWFALHAGSKESVEETLFV